MISKFVYKLFFVSFAITANSFCTDNQIQKRFGCHNFASVEKIASMNSNNTNTELLRNLERCMRDTDTYNKENFNIVQKLNRDFVQADEERSYTSNKDTAAMMCLVAIHPITFDVCYPLFRAYYHLIIMMHNGHLK